MEIIKYAPVIIPTLNRYIHFKQCLESLEKCKWAENTDIYIALDYPPSEKYVEGWKKIDLYLKEKEKKNGFKSLTIYRRKENYFFSGKDNAGTAITEILKRHDRFIFSEDDNVFSYRFLDYINEGLEKYKYNKDVFAICGYIHPYGFSPEKYSGNCVFLQEMSAWGYGTWADRRINKKDQFQEISTYIKNKELRYHFSKNRPTIFTGLLKMKLYNIIWGDCLYTANLFVTKRFCIFPLISLVQNHGWDGSGTHGGKVKGFSNQEIEGHIEDSFILNPITKKEQSEIEELIIKYWQQRTSLVHKLLAWLEIKIYSTTGKIITFKNLTDKAKKIRSWWYSLKQ